MFNLSFVPAHHRVCRSKYIFLMLEKAECLLKKWIPTLNTQWANGYILLTCQIKLVQAKLVPTHSKQDSSSDWSDGSRDININSHPMKSLDRGAGSASANHTPRRFHMAPPTSPNCLNVASTIKTERRRCQPSLFASPSFGQAAAAFNLHASNIRKRQCLTNLPTKLVSIDDYYFHKAFIKCSGVLYLLLCETCMRNNLIAKYSVKAKYATLFSFIVPASFFSGGFRGLAEASLQRRLDEDREDTLNTHTYTHTRAHTLSIPFTDWGNYEYLFSLTTHGLDCGREPMPI